MCEPQTLRRFFGLLCLLYFKYALTFFEISKYFIEK